MMLRASIFSAWPCSCGVRAPTMVTAAPCWTRRCDSVVMSASTGTWRKVSGSSLKRAAVISGSAAFLAPPMGMVPESGFPPRMRILSIGLNHLATARGLGATGPAGCKRMRARAQVLIKSMTYIRISGRPRQALHRARAIGLCGGGDWPGAPRRAAPRAPRQRGCRPRSGAVVPSAYRWAYRSWGATMRAAPCSVKRGSIVAIAILAERRAAHGGLKLATQIVGRHMRAAQHRGHDVVAQQILQVGF